MEICEIPAALIWCNWPPILDKIHNGYCHRLSHVFDSRLSEDVPDGSHRSSILEFRRRLDKASFERFLTAPETSRRILWSSATMTEALPFWAGALLAECLREGEKYFLEKETWSALGDVCFCPDGSRKGWSQIFGSMPLDFGSPYAVSVDLTGASFRARQARAALTKFEIARAFSKVEKALGKIRESSEVTASFVNRFTKVLIIQKDDEAPDQCQSGSNGQYIGRSFVTNLQSPVVSEEAVAEAIVHEAVHGLLYMGQVLEPWGPNEVVYDQTARVPSPWSGRHLPTRSFLEASFVWFGLLHFWCYAVKNATFDRLQTRSRLLKAAKGFLGPPLVDMLTDRSRLNSSLIEAVEGMQMRVREAAP